MIALKSFQRTVWSGQASVHQWLLLSSFFSCLLLVVRVLVTDTLNYIFLPWNLFLAFIPYCIARWITTDVSLIENRFKLTVALALWLLFVPNTFYIITDLFHLTHIDSAPKWFDLLLLFSFAWNGLLFGIISLRKVEMVLTLIRGRGFSLLIIFVVMMLNAMGIYIGRFLRFNSWDIITNPFELFGEIAGMVFHPFHNSYEWGMIGSYAVFMTLIYVTVKKMGEAFRHHL